ncbi:hypothetical protein [Streptomyces subrutilus]|uniref:hypothetical protein n=1 Tax=Streptomyces subrutilus TaxID=36818 RepID=UPI00114D0FD9|nr:hypothetical protein [Streptomyces subrutilus]
MTLTLAALAMATGCVTVRPAAPSDALRPGPGEVHPEARQPAPAAWPLGHLPATPEPLPPPPRPAASAAPAPAAAARQERPARPPRAAKPVRHARPARPVEPAKPRKRTSAKPAAKPAVPQRTYDMAALCEAARGTVSPSIVALCR